MTKPTRAFVPDLLDDVFDAEQFSQENLAGAILWLPLAKIYDNPYQTRTDYDPAHIAALADNIYSLRNDLPATHGLQQPPLARLVQFATDGDTRIADRSVYTVAATVRKLARSERHGVELHFGHNRLRAWRLLRERDADRYAKFPVLLAYADDQSMWRHAVTENAQRKDISAIEEALSIRQAMTAFDLTLEQAGEPFGYAKSTVSNKLRLLDLPDAARSLLASGAITERHGRELLRLAPAPHLLAELSRRGNALGDLSVRQLAAQVDLMIARCTPISPAPRTGYTVIRYNDDTYSKPFDPPAWPLDWAPATPQASIIGACRGCRFYAHFGGDAGARCTQGEQFNACYGVKERQWNTEQAAAQSAALVAAQAAAVTTDQPAAPAAPSAPATATTPAPAAAKTVYTGGKLTVPAAPAVTTATTPITWFSTEHWRGAPAALIEKGHCSQNRCECWTLAYNPEAADHHVRPDAVNAPNLCIGCKSEARLRNRRTEMEHGDVQEHRKRLKAEDQESERLLRAWLESASAAEIWHNAEFMRSLVVNGFDIDQSYKAKNWDLHTLEDGVFLGVAKQRCMRWDNNTRRWSLDGVRQWLAALDVAAGRTPVDLPTFDASPAPATASGLPALDIPMPGQGVPFAQPPATGWTDGDERSHQCLMAEWDGASWQSLEKLIRRCVTHDDAPCIVTPTLIRHIARDCPAPAVRTELHALADWQEALLATQAT